MKMNLHLPDDVVDNLSLLKGSQSMAAYIICVLREHPLTSKEKNTDANDLLVKPSRADKFHNEKDS